VVNVIAEHPLTKAEVLMMNMLIRSKTGTAAPS
jgi:hypothetical protein